MEVDILIKRFKKSFSSAASYSVCTRFSFMATCLKNSNRILTSSLGRPSMARRKITFTAFLQTVMGGFKIAAATAVSFANVMSGWGIITDSPITVG